MGLESARTKYFLVYFGEQSLVNLDLRLFEGKRVNETNDGAEIKNINFYAYIFIP